MSQSRSQPGHEAYEPYEPLSRHSLQRQQPQQRSISLNRPSSSSGSLHTLRRTPKFDEQRRPSRRRASVGATERRDPDRPAEQAQQRILQHTLLPFSDDGASSTTATVAPDFSPEHSYWPRRTTRVSRSTATAILFVLQEAIRTPFPFTPDYVEENAPMSELGGAAATGLRSQNGGSRAASGPTPVSNPVRIMTPTDVMRRRRERERESEARAAGAAGVGGVEPPVPQERQERVIRREPAVAQETGDRRRTDRPVSGSASRVNPTSGAQPVTYPAIPRREEPGTTSRTAAETGGRTRATSTSQPASRPTQQQNARASATHTPQQQQQQTSQTRLPSAQAGTTNRAQVPSANPSFQRPQTQPTTNNQTRSGTTSSFPHAFERWETLSSHWEGLTSFWIKRLEGNSEELSGQPLNQQLARQVTDLSAAGANLFHAVVELQRLRASSERKFQRWFYETRLDQEKTQEKMAKLEEDLRLEKEARTREQADRGGEDEAAAARHQRELQAEHDRLERELRDVQQRDTERTNIDEVNRVKKNCDQIVKEMRRELQISREEARRGWEEIGRMEQAERDRTYSLKQGHPTHVGGVQVVPMPQGGTSLHASSRSGHGGGLSSHPVQPSDPGDAEHGYTSYDPARSETDTDPFTESGRDATTAPAVPRIPTSMQQTSASSSAAAQAARTAATTNSVSPNRSAALAPGTSGASSGTYRQDFSQQTPTSSSFYQQGSAPALHGGVPRTTDVDERSYVETADDTISEEDFELDERGQIRRDSQGMPISQRRGPASDDSDEYNVIEEMERERMYRQRYGTGVSGVEYGHGSPATTNGAYVSQPDYSGTGYGSAWDSVVPRHHHPTRLSDVLEEDEKSRTSPSRASERSRNLR